MSTKPSAPFVWDSGLVNITAPTGGQITSGYAVNAIPTSGCHNFSMNVLGLFTQYLWDGDLALSGFSLATSSVAIANATTNDLDLTGGAGLAGHAVVRITGGGSSAILTGFLSTGAVEGRCLLLVNETAVPFLISAEDTGSAAANRIDVQGAGAGVGCSVPPKGVVLLRYTDPPTGRWSISLTNFALDYTTKTIDFPAMSGREIGGANHTLAINKWTTGASTDQIGFPIQFPNVGRMITGWSLNVKKNSSAAATIIATLYREVLSTGAVTQIGSSAASSAGAPGTITLSVSGLNEVVLAGYSYYVKFDPTSGASGDEVYGGTIVHTSTTGV